MVALTQPVVVICGLERASGHDETVAIFLIYGIDFFPRLLEFIALDLICSIAEQ